MPGLDRKLYQLIVSRLDGENIVSSSYREKTVELVQRGIGGFILFGGKKDEVKPFLQDLQTLSEDPLFIASDIERGAGQQIAGATSFPGQMAIAAALSRKDDDSLQCLEEAIKAIAREAIDIGINMPLIPVLDVNRNPDNPIICTRAFSDSPESVAWYGNLYIKTLEDEGLISCAKHFPGHGDTAVDSHISLPVISKSFSKLKDIDLYPFIEAIKSGVSSIMVGHLSVNAIDELPSSLSKKLITDLLRTDFGYEGLVLTDALNMHALNKFNHVPSQCINAGVDILLHPADADGTVRALHHAAASGEIKEEAIDRAVERILKFKSRINRIQQTEVDYVKHARLSAGISDKAISLLKNTPGVLPLAAPQSASLVAAADENRHDFTVLKNLASHCIHLKDLKEDALKETVIFVLFTRIAAWEGSSGIIAQEIRIIRALLKKTPKSIVLSFGSPYVLRHFREADVLIAAYDSSPQAQSSVIKCLKGEIDFMGKLPVKI